MKRLSQGILLLFLPLVLYAQGIPLEQLRRLASQAVSQAPQLPQQPPQPQMPQPLILPEDTLPSPIERMFMENYGYHYAPSIATDSLLRDSLIRVGVELTLRAILGDTLMDTLIARGLREDLLRTVLGQESLKTHPLIPEDLRKVLGVFYPERTLRQFGYELFRYPLPQQQSLQGIVSENYVLKPGDQVILYFSGAYNEVTELTVSDDGLLPLPKVGPMAVAGRPWGEVKEAITHALQESFKNTYVVVTLGVLRPLNLTVVGEVRRPGTITVSPGISLIQVLAAAGGVKKTGSLRQILYRKLDGRTFRVDLYDLLIHGKPPNLPPVEDGDMVFVPVIGPVVGINGMVPRPGIYEMRGNTTLTEALEMAGGLLAVGYPYLIRIERVENGTVRTVAAAEAHDPDDLRKVGLKNGDLITVIPIPPEPVHKVLLLGPVMRPGEYPWEPGLTLKTLIEKAGGLKPEAYPEKVQILRRNGEGAPRLLSLSLDGDADPVLEDLDVVRIFSRQEVLGDAWVEVQGQVARPGRVQYLPGMTLADLILQAGGPLYPVDSGRVELVRRDTVLFLDLRSTEGKNFPLQAGDRVALRPLGGMPGTVWLTGKVRYPGLYVLRQGETVASLIERAGGLLPDAYGEGVQLYRKPLEKERKDLSLYLANLGLRAVKGEKATLPVSTLSPVEARQQEEALQAYEEAASLFIPPPYLNRLVLSIQDPEARDTPLQDGDSLYVPPVPTTVRIEGAVYYPTAIPYREGLTLKACIEAAGGLRKEAERKAIFVVRANGQVTHNPEQILPGDVIVVPERFKVERSFWRIAMDLSQILYQIAVGIATVVVLTRR